ncbi:uncharacterized protein METZ01_LOCUS241449, partial [marine metagenome]
MGATALASLAKAEWLSAASGSNSIGGLPG